MFTGAVTSALCALFAAVAAASIALALARRMRCGLAGAARVWRRSGKIGRVLLAAAVCGFIAYGSTKLAPGGGTIDGDYPTEDASALMSLMLTLTDVSMVADVSPWSVEPSIPTNAVVYERWSRRGAYNDHFRVNFTNDWVFPVTIVGNNWILVECAS